MRSSRPSDRVADGRLALEERRGLPDEVVVVAIGAGREVDRQRGHGEAEPDGDASRDARGASRRRARGLCGVRRATLCYAPIHLPRSCRSRSR